MAPLSQQPWHEYQEDQADGGQEGDALPGLLAAVRLVVVDVDLP